MSDLSNPKSQRKEQDVQKQIELIESDRNEMDQLRRFGFFTIPYPATVGDLAYTSTNVKLSLLSLSFNISSVAIKASIKGIAP